MRKHNLAFIDIETTGLNMIEHEIIEIGCVIVDQKLEILEEFELKIKPKHIENADKVALKITRYNEKDWESGYTLGDAIEIFSNKVKDCIMIAQNIAFDSGFLEYTFAKLKLSNTMHYHKLDTISVAWAKLHKKPDLDHFSLREMCKRFGIENKNPHSALSDARATLEVYKKLMTL
ncbi:3'-5' exonuclease [Patescibacteria group bacterium]|nr:3'-5' exonuclease [Patescibacteria group bacterium]MBU1728259.1 3'-5' exonuclease [Patescibacteria group bacterium]